MAAPYIPPKNGAFIAWAANFSTLLTASPSTYGSDAPTAANIASLNTPLQAAYVVITNPATKSKTTVLAYNNAKQAFLASVRPLAVLISRNPGVASSDKTNIGVNLPNNTPTPIPAPSTSPIISFTGATPGQHTYTFADQNTPAKRIKPQGVLQLQTVVAIGTAPATDPTTVPPGPAVTKSPFPVTFASGDAGKIATIWGRWVTRKGLTGPWSSAVSQVIPAT